ncbi:T-complex protein 1 subunit eta-like [Primulina huaijiensis]|uniref:T-complex protein 1 subunit eta-like n=1 Tax=Primulina huaijiensis TaxID=1492673 RepID=UPI003CC731A8
MIYEIALPSLGLVLTRTSLYLSDLSSSRVSGSGFDAIDVLNKLRQKHALPSGEGGPYGVDINTGGIADSFTNFIWEPPVVKIHAINAATETACLISSVDETAKNPKSESAQGDAAACAMGPAFRVRVRGMRRR